MKYNTYSDFNKDKADEFYLKLFSICNTYKLSLSLIGLMR